MYSVAEWNLTTAYGLTPSRATQGLNGRNRPRALKLARRAAYLAKLIGYYYTGDTGSIPKLLSVNTMELNIMSLVSRLALLGPRSRYPRTYKQYANSPYSASGCPHAGSGRARSAPQFFRPSLLYTADTQAAICFTRYRPSLSVNNCTAFGCHAAIGYINAGCFLYR